MLPTWLSAHDTEDIPKYPTTAAQRALVETTFESLFEITLEQIAEGCSIERMIRNDPRGLSYGKFIRWIKRDKQRLERYEEAQMIGAEILVEEMQTIADATEPGNMEDVARSTLRVGVRKWRVQQYNKKRYGDDKSNPTSFGQGGITIVIGDVAPQPAAITGNTFDMEQSS